ncbi:hypothetical protein HK101_001357, partial [Irineochytrium annulatum]
SSIVVVNSLAGKVALPNVHAYSASKHAIDAWFACLRLEMYAEERRLKEQGKGRYGRVNVTNAVLGAIKTPAMEGLLRGKADLVVKAAASSTSTATAILHAQVDKVQQFEYPPMIRVVDIINKFSHRAKDVIVNLAT